MIGDLARDHRATILVTALGSAFGVVLLGAVSLLEQIARASQPTLSASDNGGAILQMMAIAFLTLSIYVGAIVTANTFSTIIAGRTSRIALLRLLGDTARSQRRAVVRESLAVGVIGAATGAAAGLVLEIAAIRILVVRGVAPDVAYSYVGPTAIFPVVAVVVATVIAGRVGSRDVLRVSPMEATSIAQEASIAETTSRRGRHVVAVLSVVAGSALLALGVVVGQVTAGGVLIGLLGGILSFSGLVAAADAVMPRCLRVVGLAFGSSAPARLASANAVRHPDRSARSTIGMVVGVTLVTTFAVTLTTLQNSTVAAGGSPQSFAPIIVVFTGLVGFSALIAAIGMVNTLSLSVHQRRRELGMLRTLGFTRRQIRRMILAESAQMTTTSVALGLLLGTLYGWCGAQATLGSVTHGLVAPSIPLPLVLTLVLAAFALAALASLAPSRRATRVSPVDALRVA